MNRATLTGRVKAEVDVEYEGRVNVGGYINVNKLGLHPHLALRVTGVGTPITAIATAQYRVPSIKAA